MRILRAASAADAGLTLADSILLFSEEISNRERTDMQLPA